MGHAEASISDLVRKVRNGDKDALNELCRLLLPWVRTEAGKRLGKQLRRELESCDIAQEAIKAGLKYVGNLDDSSEDALKGLLVRVIENRIRDAADYHRAGKRDIKKKQRLAGPGSSVPFDVPEKSGRASPSKLLEKEEDAKLILRALNQLRPEDRKLIIAVRKDEQTYEQIAKELGKSVDAVRMRYERARKKFRTTYDGLIKTEASRERHRRGRRSVEYR